MIQVNLNNIPFSYENGIITISEKNVQFGTEYNVISPKGGNKVFKFTHSTGPEFDKDTKWMYESDDKLKLAVCNDPVMVKVAAAKYLKGKSQGSNNIIN